MESSSSNQNTGLSGNVMFYKNPQPLSAEQHGGLGIKTVEQPFAFLREAHAVPVTVSEFGMLGASYPIIFVGEDRSPVAVMGIRQSENLFVTDQGMVDADFYTPAFARRYPFVFANDAGSDRLLLCVDRDAEIVTNQPEIPFFSDGNPTEYTNNAIEFCKEFERQRRATLEFVGTIQKLDLFSEKTVTFQARDQSGNAVGEPQKIADYWAVDEEKFNALSDEQFLELRTNGALSGIYAHLVSLLNWNRIIQRAVKVQQEEAANS